MQYQSFIFLWAVSAFVDCLASAFELSIDINGSPEGSSNPVAEAFLSFSIEMGFFPDYAGNLSTSNNFTNNLLINLEHLMGSKPLMRIGGNTQDQAIYNSSLDQAAWSQVDPEDPNHYPNNLQVGRSFFESYEALPDVKFIHGFNLARQNETDRQALLASVPLVCEALSGGRLHNWELGNEPNFYQGGARPDDWATQNYVEEWLNMSSRIDQVISDQCADEYDGSAYIAPSIYGTSRDGPPGAVSVWESGLHNNSNIAQVCAHNYVSCVGQPDISLQGTLMNHTRTMESIDAHVRVMQEISDIELPYTLGESNSICGMGQNGLSDSFGAALWGVDFYLYAASQSIHRVFLHQGHGFPYSSWFPVEKSWFQIARENETFIGTRAPYYGNIAIAAMLGNSTSTELRIKHVDTGKETLAAYVAYVDGSLKRIMAIDMNGYNFSSQSQQERPSTDFSFQLPSTCENSTSVNRLLANGSDAVTGISWNGYSYNWDLNEGLPTLLENTTRNEVVDIVNGRLSVSLPHSSAVMINLDC